MIFCLLKNATKGTALMI